MKIARLAAAAVLASLVAAEATVVAQNVPGDPLFTENFDGVTAPALPPGWVATNDQGPDPVWATDAGKWDTAPNSAHVDDPDVVGDKRLDSPPIHIYTNEAELRFQQVTEFCIGDMKSFYDGGVLEISIDGGPFQDIQDAGGTANTTGPITGAGNPLEGRQGWTWRSNQGAYVFTDAIVTLPPVGGKSVVLRWEVGGERSAVRQRSLRMVDRFRPDLRRRPVRHEPGRGAPRCGSRGKRSLGAGRNGRRGPVLLQRQRRDDHGLHRRREPDRSARARTTTSSSERRRSTTRSRRAPWAAASSRAFAIRFR